MWTKHGIMTDRGIVSGFSWNFGKGLALLPEQSVRFCGWSASESDPDPGFLHVFLTGNLLHLSQRIVLGMTQHGLEYLQKRFCGWSGFWILDFYYSRPVALAFSASLLLIGWRMWNGFLKTYFCFGYSQMFCLGGVTSEKKAAVPKTEVVCAC